MGATINANHKEPATSFRFKNTTGAALVANEFTVMRGRVLRAVEAIASLASGGFADLNGCKFEADSFVTSEAAFASADLAVYFNPTQKKFSNTATVGNYLVGHSDAAISGGILDVIGCVPILVVDGVATLAAAVEAAEDDISALKSSGIPFRKTVSLVSAAAATPVHIVTAAEVAAVDAAAKVFISGFFLKVDGATAWTDTTGTKVSLQDTADTPVEAVAFAKAQLTDSAALAPGSTGVSLKDPVSEGSGLTAGKGLDIVADSNFDAGDTIKVTVFGYIAAA